MPGLSVVRIYRADPDYQKYVRELCPLAYVFAHKLFLSSPYDDEQVQVQDHLRVQLMRCHLQQE